MPEQQDLFQKKDRRLTRLVVPSLLGLTIQAKLGMVLGWFYRTMQQLKSRESEIDTWRNYMKANAAIC